MDAFVVHESVIALSPVMQPLRAALNSLQIHRFVANALIFVVFSIMVALGWRA